MSFLRRLRFTLSLSHFNGMYISRLTPHGKKMHVKEIYVIFIHLFDSGILLIIDLNKKNHGHRGPEFFFNKKLILDFYFCLKSGPVFLYQIFIIAPTKNRKFRCVYMSNELISKTIWRTNFLAGCLFCFLYFLWIVGIILKYTLV
jgi:hypothetical protein